MELNLDPATEAKLNELAQRTGRGADDLIDEPSITSSPMTSGWGAR